MSKSLRQTVHLLKWKQILGAIDGSLQSTTIQVRNYRLLNQVILNPNVNI